MSERLDIKNMMVEPEKIPSRRFDPEQEMTDKEWSRIFDARQGYARSMNEGTIEDRAVWGHFFSGQTVFGTIAGKEMEVTDKQWNAIANYRRLFSAEKNWRSFAPFATLEIIAGKEFTITDREWREIATIRRAYFNEGSMDEFSPLATLELVAGRAVDMTEVPWEIITNTRRAAAVRRDWHRYAQLASFELVADAQEIRRQPDGKLEFIYPETEQDKEETPPPKQRKF